MTDAEHAGPGWPRNPWLSMWVRPRGTIRRILDTDPHRRILVLAVLMGLSQLFGGVEEPPLDDDMPLTLSAPIAVVIAPLAGLLTLYVSGALTWWTGRWIGGAAGAFQLRAALAWSNIPLIWALALEPLRLVVLGPEHMFTPIALDGEPGTVLFFSLYLLAFIGATLWTVVLMARSVAEAQGFASSWKGLGNLVLATLALAVPVLLVVLAFAALAGL